MAFINQGRHLSVVGLTAAALMELQIKWQGNIPDPSLPGHTGEQFPYRGTPGTSQELERTLVSLPDFQVGETVTGSANSYTATFEGVTLVGTTELATSVGGGFGGQGEQAGWGGGSGGGGASNNWGNSGGGLAVAGQGNAGGLGGDRNGHAGASGGGGGAGVAGSAGGGTTGGAGGNGANNDFRTGINIIYAGGGGGAGGDACPSSIATGGTGGGGTGVSGTVNTGGGGGTGNAPPSNGGSGIVVVRYDTSQGGFSLAGGTTNTYITGAVNYKSHTFLTSGSIVVTGTGNIDTLILSGGGGSGGHGCTGGVEGGWFRGGGGAGGMHVATNTQIVPGTYTVAVGAGGTGGTASDQMAGVGNLSWITPRRTISLSEPTGAFVTGETLTGETSGAIGDIITYTP